MLKPPRDIVAADEAVRPAVELPVDVEVVDGDVRAAGVHERVEVAALEEQGRAGAGLVAVVLADHALLRDRIVGLADAGEQHQVHVVDGIGAQQHDAGRLLELFAVEHVGIGHAGDALAVGVLETFVTQEWVRSSKFGLRIAIGITAICGLPLAFASQPKRWQKPQYWQAPKFAPSGLV